MRPAVAVVVVAGWSLVAVLPTAARAQFLDGGTAATGPNLGDVRTQKYKVGLVVTAEGGPCTDLYATLPVSAALRVDPLPWRDGEGHLFPKSLQDA